MKKNKEHNTLKRIKRLDKHLRRKVGGKLVSQYDTTAINRLSEFKQP